MSKVKAKGNGGDPEENDVEAILKGIQKYPDFKNLILIADNNSCMRDYCLVKDIKVPVKVVLCGTYSGINPQYINLAYKTKGSIHTIEDDISDFYNRTNTDATFMIDGSLGSDTLAAGDTISGFLAFEVPDGDAGLRLQYSPSFWTNKKLETVL